MLDEYFYHEWRKEAGDGFRDLDDLLSVLESTCSRRRECRGTSADDAPDRQGYADADEAPFSRALDLARTICIGVIRESMLSAAREYLEAREAVAA